MEDYVIVDKEVRAKMLKVNEDELLAGRNSEGINTRRIPVYLPSEGLPKDICIMDRRLFSPFDRLTGRNSIRPY